MPFRKVLVLDKLRGFGRLVVRIKGYSNSGATWTGDFQVVIPVLLGFGTGAWNGALAFALLYALRIITGYLDLEHVHATDYLNEFIGNRAPSRTIIVERKA